MSTTIARIGSVTGIPAPLAAAIGSSIRYTWLAPAFDAASRIARRSTEVEPDGTQITISGQRGKRRGPCTFWMKCLIICSATSMSAIRSEEHTSELQSLMRNSYAVFCLKKTKTHQKQIQHPTNKTDI